MRFPAATGHVTNFTGFTGRALALLERRLGITSTGIGIAVLAVAGWFLATRMQSQPMFLLSIALVFVCVAAYVMASKRLGLEAVRSALPARVREGQPVDVELSLTARRRVTTIVVEEELHQQLGATVRVPIAALGRGTEMAHAYAFTPRLRGVYRVGPLTATWTDPFGVTRKRLLLAEPQEITVHPQVERVEDRVLSRAWEDPPIRPPVSRPWPTGFEFYGMRDYQPGDDPRRIVWRATAKVGKHLVRESEQGITDAVSVILDTDRAWHSPGEPSETFELGIRVVASLGTQHLKDGFSLTAQTNGGTIANSLRGPKHRVTLLDQLARLQPEAKPFADALQAVLLDKRRNTHMVFVTPYLTTEAARLTRLLTDRGVSVLLVLLLWENSEPDFLHRAGSLGTNLVEVTSGAPLQSLFRRVRSARGARR